MLTEYSLGENVVLFTGGFGWQRVIPLGLGVLEAGKSHEEAGKARALQKQGP